MMGREPEDATSHRVASLAKKLRSKKYRDSYLSSHTRMFLANQIASLQGEMSQNEFGELLGKPQPIISRLQNPAYGKYTLQTLLEIASKLDVALIARFVDYATFLKLTNDFSDEALRPASFDPNQLDLLSAITDSPRQPLVMGHIGSPVHGESFVFMGPQANISQGLQSPMPKSYASLGGVKNE